MIKRQKGSEYFIQSTIQSAKSPKRHWPRLLTFLLCLLSILALAHFIAIHQIGTPAVVSANRAKNCAALIHNTDYTKIVPIRARTQQMAAIQFVDASTGGQPSALIQVNATGPQQKLDAYIYGCRQTSYQKMPILTQLFKQQGLINGIINITQIHTLSVEQTDITLPSDSDTLLQPLQQNVFQEYAWKNNSLSQISFPGLYPVTSRSEAEALQDDANNGQALPWTNPLATAQQMAKDLFHWPTKMIHGVLHNIGNTEAQVILEEKGTNIQIAVSLTRLIQSNSKGLWWVTSAQTPGISLDQSRFSAAIASPITIQGIINPTQGIITATLFDHTLSPIHLIKDSTLHADTNGQFSGELSYTNIFPDQPGLLLVTAYPRDRQEEGYLFLTNILLK
jgi:hypothetical protein